MTGTAVLAVCVESVARRTIDGMAAPVPCADCRERIVGPAVSALSAGKPETGSTIGRTTFVGSVARSG